MTRPKLLHDDLDRLDEGKGSSDRGFGLTFAVVAAIFALWPLLAGERPRWWLIAIALALVAVSFAAPAALRPFNKVWHRFGLLLHRFVSPVILAVVFYGVVTPMGLVLRAFGRDLLRLRFDAGATTYWITRDPPGPAPKSMNRQF